MTAIDEAPAIAPIDAQTAYDLLAAAVAERGANYLYTSPGEQVGNLGCKYIYNGKPSCIIGAALAAHGVPLDVMRPWDAGNGYTISSAARLFRADFITPGARAVFASAQAVQDRAALRGDRSATWGAALARAARTLAEELACGAF